MTMKTTKHQTKQTLLEKLSGPDWSAEIDWDLLEQLDLEEEGQPVPMQDLPASQSQEASSQEEPIRQTIPSEAVLQKFLT